MLDLANVHRDDLNPLEQAFLEASREYERRIGLARSLRKGNVWLVGASALLVVATLISLGMFLKTGKELQAAIDARAKAQAERDAAQLAEKKAEYDQRKANGRFRRAEVLRLAAEAELVLDQDTQRAVLLAVEALGVTARAGGPRVSEAEDVLRRALGDSAARAPLPGDALRGESRWPMARDDGRGRHGPALGPVREGATPDPPQRARGHATARRRDQPGRPLPGHV